MRDLIKFPLISTEIPLPTSKGDQIQESQIQTQETTAQNNSLIFLNEMLRCHALLYSARETRDLVYLADRDSLKIQVVNDKLYLSLLRTNFFTAGLYGARKKADSDYLQIQFYNRVDIKWHRWILSTNVTQAVCMQRIS